MGNLVSQKHEDKFDIEVAISDDRNIVITNKNTKEKVEIEVEQLIDFIVLETDDYYVVAYEDYQGKNNPFLYYNYVKKSDLSNEEGYLKSLKDAGIKTIVDFRGEATKDFANRCKDLNIKYVIKAGEVVYG